MREHGAPQPRGRAVQWPQEHGAPQPREHGAPAPGLTVLPGVAESLELVVVRAAEPRGLRRTVDAALGCCVGRGALCRRDPGTRDAPAAEQVAAVRRTAEEELELELVLLARWCPLAWKEPCWLPVHSFQAAAGR